MRPTSKQISVTVRSLREHEHRALDALTPLQVAVREVL
jgi:hypothetical protein